VIALDGGRRNYRVVRDGDVIGSLEPPGWLTDGAMSVGEQSWRLVRSGRQYAARGAQSDLTAERARWGLRWEIVGSVAPYYVEAAGTVSRQWRVLRGRKEIGRSDIQGFWTPKAAIALPDDVPAVDQVFLLWIMQDGIYRRTNGAAGGGAG
jgi:hypothetical protein